MKPAVTASVKLPASVDAALDQFLDIPSLQQWWGVSHALVERRDGGIWALGWDRSSHGYRYVSSGVIATYVPGERLTIGHLVYFSPDRAILGPMRLDVTVAPAPADESGCVLTVRQDGYQDGADWDWYHDAVVTGWPAALEVLAQHVRRQRDVSQRATPAS